jgi:hypothetical protein
MAAEAVLFTFELGNLLYNSADAKLQGEAESEFEEAHRLR